MPNSDDSAASPAWATCAKPGGKNCIAVFTSDITPPFQPPDANAATAPVMPVKRLVKPPARSHALLTSSPESPSTISAPASRPL